MNYYLNFKEILIFKIYHKIKIINIYILFNLNLNKLMKRETFCFFFFIIIW